MGLDMYLHKKVYVQNWEHMKPEDKHHITYALGDNIPEEINPAYLVFEVGYWRKANAIHQWFVKNVQDGVDECQDSYVELTDLEALLEAVNTVLSRIIVENGDVYNGESWSKDNGHVVHTTPGRVVTNPEVCEEFLPSQGGFFFGGTDYDEWYLQSLEHTRDVITKVIADAKTEAENHVWADYYYHSSW
jgi:hypothetical protein